MQSQGAVYQRQNRIAISICFINELPFFSPAFHLKYETLDTCLTIKTKARLPQASLKQAIVWRAVVVEGKACQEFISIWKNFSGLYLFQEFLKHFKYSPMKCFRHCFNTDYVFCPWARCFASIHVTVFSKALILTLTNPILSPLGSLSKYCGWNHYSQNETISAFPNTLQEKYSSPIAQVTIRCLQ